MRGRAPLVAAAVALALVACDRRLEPFIPAEREPPAPERPVRVPGLENPRPSAPMLAAQGRQGATIQGVVRLAEGVDPAGGGVLFVIARSPAGGPPLAAVRLPLTRFPVAFEIGPDDAMIEGRPLAGPIVITARVDRDGDPMTRSADDLVAALEGRVEPGASGVELVLEAASP